MNDEISFDLIPAAPQKSGSRWTGGVIAVGETGAEVTVPVRPCKTKRELMARADILAARMSAVRGYDPRLAN